MNDVFNMTIGDIGYVFIVGCAVSVALIGSIALFLAFKRFYDKKMNKGVHDK